MEFYPPELVTPPLALVALLGCPRLHPVVGEFLRSQQKPPINSLGVADPWSAARLFGERKVNLTAPSDRTGILKADWFAKHRKRRPAVAVLLLERSAVVGEVGAWQVSCSAMEAVKTAAKTRGARLVVMVVGAGGELPEERAGAISRIASVDKKRIMTFDPAEEEAGLKLLGRLLYEAAGQFYLDAARRRLSLHAERRSHLPELNARVTFKAAALAEFRADWATAVKTYQNSYAEIARVPLGPPLPLQRAWEVAAVAEQVHVKIVTLLLHQQRVAEALQQFRGHLGLFKHPPFAPPLAFTAAHWGWVSRQYAAMGELIGRVDPSLLPPQKDAQPPYFFLCAAQAAIERRKAAQAIVDSRRGEAPRALEATPVAGNFLGQMALLDSQRRLTDEEFCIYLEGEEAKVDQSRQAVEALGVAQELCTRAAGSRGTRQAYFIGRLLAKEHLVAGDPGTAHRLLLLVAGIYRREQWQVPLAAALLDVVQCSQRLDLKQEQVLHLLEISVLSEGLPLDSRKEKAAVALRLLNGEGAPPQEEAAAATPAAGPMQLQVRPVNHPLLSCFSLAAGFRTAKPQQSEPSEGDQQLRFGVAIQSRLPLDVASATLEVSFRVGEEVVLVPCTPLDPEQQGIPAGGWGQWEASLAPDPTAVAVAENVVLKVGEGSSISWNLPSFPGFEVIRGSQWEGQGVQGDSPAFRQPRFSFQAGLYQMSAADLQDPPTIKVRCAGFALVGETASLVLEVSHRRPSSEATISLRGGFLEGGAPPRLSLRDAEGATWEGVEGSEGGASDFASPAMLDLGTIRLGPQEADPDPGGGSGGSLTLEVALELPHAGQLQLVADYFSQAGSEGEPQATASAEVLVEAPFQLSSRCSSLPHTTSLILDTQGGEGLEVLPASQVCLVESMLRVTAPTEVEVSSVTAEPVSGVELTATAASSRVARLCKGDVLTTCFKVRRGEAGAVESLGVLLVTWNRSGSKGQVRTRLRMAGVRFCSPALQVEGEVPGAAVAGQGFTAGLLVSNMTPLLQQVSVAVGDASGFVMSGSRHEALTILPLQKKRHALTLVGYHPGTLPLPHVKLTSQRYNAALEPWYGHSLLVAPPPAQSQPPHLARKHASIA